MVRSKRVWPVAVLLLGGCLSDPTVDGATLVLCGDSTMATYAFQDGMVGWGQTLARNLRKGTAVFNHAIPGATAESFVREGLPGALAAGADIALIQFGHNLNDSLREATFLDSIVAAFRARRTRPILVTPMRDRRDVVGSPALDAGIRQAGERLGCPVVPLDSLSHAAWAKAGTDSLEVFFYDQIHLTGAGAARISAMVAAWISPLEPELRP